MVGPEERANEFPGLLVGLVHSDAFEPQLLGIEHQRNFGQTLPATLLVRVLLEERTIAFWDHVPDLGRPAVVIVQGVHAAVLDVPAERGEEHAHIDPWGRDSADVFPVA